MSTRDLPSSLQSAMTAAALKRAGRRRRRAVFLIHAPELFSAVEPVVQEMQRRPDVFDLVFFALPRNCSGQPTGRFSGMEETYLFLDRKGLRPLALAGRSDRDIETLIRLAPDYVFRQSPWALDIPAVFDASMLGFTQLCYVPYGLMMIDQPAHQYNQDFHNACDFIFCENEFQYEGFANHRVMGTHGVQATGYPRFEQLIAGLAAPDAANWPLAAPAGTPRVIWAPHHTPTSQWLGYSTFMQHKDAMLEEARRGRLSLLLRPHPALKDRLVALNLMGSSEYDAYLQAFATAGCSGVDGDREYVRSFAASDAMITDGVGFFAEYLLTGKPLIRTRRHDSTPLNAFAQWLVQACDDVDDGAQLGAALEALATHRHADTKAALRDERRQRLTAMGEGASRRIVDALEAA